MVASVACSESWALARSAAEAWGAGARAFDVAADFAPDVQSQLAVASAVPLLVVKRSACCLVALPVTPMVGNRPARASPISARRFAVGSLGFLDGLVVDVDALFECVEVGVVEDGPPGAAAGAVGRFGELPAGRRVGQFLVGERDAVLGRWVVGADLTAGERCSDQQGGQQQTRCALQWCSRLIHSGTPCGVVSPRGAAMAEPAAEAVGEAAEGEVDDGGGEQGQQLAQDQTAGLRAIRPPHPCAPTATPRGNPVVGGGADAGEERAAGLGLRFPAGETVEIERGEQSLGFDPAGLGGAFQPGSPVTPADGNACALEIGAADPKLGLRQARFGGAGEQGEGAAAFTGFVQLNRALQRRHGRTCGYDPVDKTHHACGRSNAPELR